MKETMQATDLNELRGRFQVDIPDVKEQSVRDSMLTRLKSHIEIKNEMIRRAVIQQDRADVLATKVLGYIVKDFHGEILDHQKQHPHSMTLGWRGSGKSTMGDVTFAIKKALQNPNIRILIASKTQGQAETFLKEIKGHLENNQTLVDIFGEQRHPDKWHEKEANVLPRTTHAKECTFTCIGIGGALPGRHFDIIIGDDLVDEDNSRTKAQRGKLKTWFYKVLLPTLEPDGEMHILGTRYHPDDFYHHMLTNDMAGSTLTLPAIDIPKGLTPEEGRSRWPEKFPLEWLVQHRQKMGPVFFDGQYQQDVEGMQGRIVQWDWLQKRFDTLPAGVVKWMGVDLSVGKVGGDFFAAAVVAHHRDRKEFFVEEVIRGRYTMNQQIEKIVDVARRHKAVRVGIEANAFQAVVPQQIKANANYQDVPVVPIFTQTDKTTRAWLLSSHLQDGRIHFRQGQTDLLSELVQLPDGEHDDMFDAVDIAVRMALGKVRTRKKRQTEPGVI
jgi:predicted phage terminase large subunit-like protein